jgi:hypothetical protein
MAGTKFPRGNLDARVFWWRLTLGWWCGAIARYGIDNPQEQARLAAQRVREITEQRR